MSRMSQPPPPKPPPPDMNEHGAPLRGQPQSMDRRLFMQLQVFTGCERADDLPPVLRDHGLECVLYLDATDPRGVGVLTLAEDPAVFAGAMRRALTAGPLARLVPRPGLTMLGRTYAGGREPNLEFFLFDRPRKTVMNPDHGWAIWYPLRRKPDFYQLPAEDQGRILFQHAQIGMAYGDADLAHDVRLACFGLDREDNEFVIGLVGRELAPLSKCVQEMRRTDQTAKWIASLGPFFVGRALWRSGWSRSS